MSSPPSPGVKVEKFDYATMKRICSGIVHYFCRKLGCGHRIHHTEIVETDKGNFVKFYCPACKRGWMAPRQVVTSVWIEPGDGPHCLYPPDPRVR